MQSPNINSYLETKRLTLELVGVFNLLKLISWQFIIDTYMQGWQETTKQLPDKLSSGIPTSTSTYLPYKLLVCLVFPVFLTKCLRIRGDDGYS